MGKCLCWDATIVCTLALSHLPGTSENAGAAASSAERRKTEKYRTLTPNYIFSPLGFETLGSWGPEARRFVTIVGAKIRDQSGEPRATDFLKQRISVEVQRGNAASILGTLPPSENLDELFSVPRRPFGESR